RITGKRSGDDAGAASSVACVCTDARPLNASPSFASRAKLRTSSIPSRMYGAGRDEGAAAGYHATTSISRVFPGANISLREVSLTTHRVVPTADFPVGAGNSNVGAGACASGVTMQAARNKNEALAMADLRAP